MTAHPFLPGDIATECPGSSPEVTVVSVDGDAVVVRQASGLAYEVSSTVLRHIPVTGEHVGQWARITDDDSAENGLRGTRGRVVAAQNGDLMVEPEPGQRFQPDEGCLVLVAEPEPEVARRPTYAVEVRASDGALLVDGEVYAEGSKAARVRAEADLIVRGATDPTAKDVEVARRVLGFLDSAAARARAAYPPVTGPVPAPPQRPAIRLRTEVEVDGLPSVDVALYVYPSAVDTAHAVTAAARALHDAALAALHVLVVEPADPAGGAS